MKNISQNDTKNAQINVKLARKCKTFTFDK